MSELTINFIHHIGAGEVIQAQASGLWIGLKLAFNLHIRRIKVKSDSIVVVNLTELVKFGTGSKRQKYMHVNFKNICML